MKKLRMPFKVPKGSEVRAAVCASYWKMQTKRVERLLREKEVRAILYALGALRD